MSVFVSHTLNPGEVTVPPSKSIAQRFILASALSRATTLLKNTGTSDDVIHLKEAVRSIGASVETVPEGDLITGYAHGSFPVIHCGESGLGARLMIPVAAALGGSYTITGSGTLLKRPFNDPVDFLTSAGFRFTSKGTSLPLEFSGKLKGGNFTISGKTGSQFISGLLMALPLCSGDSNLQVSDLTSLPYIELTIEVLTRFGIIVTHDNFKEFHIPGNQRYQPGATSFTIEGDYSAAAFWYVYGAISDHPIVLKGLNSESFQGDRAIHSLVQKAGAVLDVLPHQIKISKGENLPFEFDATHVPDLFPPLVVLASAAKGTSRIKGISRLIHKESNRLHTLMLEFSKMGLKTEASGEELLIHGTGKLTGAIVDSHNDHRIAMSAAIASVLTNSGVEISNPHCVSKSYPGFWNDCRV